MNSISIKVTSPRSHHRVWSRWDSNSQNFWSSSKLLCHLAQKRQEDSRNAKFQSKLDAQKYYSLCYSIVVCLIWEKYGYDELPCQEIYALLVLLVYITVRFLLVSLVKQSNSAFISTEENPSTWQPGFMESSEWLLFLAA